MSLPFNVTKLPAYQAWQSAVGGILDKVLREPVAIQVSGYAMRATLTWQRTLGQLAGVVPWTKGGEQAARGMAAMNLLLVDQAVSYWSRASGIALDAVANSARLLNRQAPVSVPHGPAHANTVVASRQGTHLRHYAAQGESKGSVLVVSSLINRFYVLDLLPEVSVIDVLNRGGLDVFVLDWGAPGAEGPARSFADYVDGFIPWAAAEAKRVRPGALHIMGYCMGGTLAAMTAAQHPELFSGLITLASPIDFHKSGIMAFWTERRFFDADLLADAFGNIPPMMLQSAFKTMAVLSSFQKYADLAENGENEGAVRHFLAVESWLEDNISFPGGLYRPYIKDCYQDNRLVQGTMEIGGRKVDLHAISMPVLNVIASRDTIAEPPSSKALMDLVGTADKTVLEYDTGHIGLTTSKRALRDLWPRVADWMKSRA